MKINWHQNPLRTTIDLDDRDRIQILRYIQNEEYYEILAGLDNWLSGKTWKYDEPNLEKVLEKVRGWSEICAMTIEHEEVKSFEDYLQMSHGGDCTCWPMTCEKCLAEAALGIDTIKGLRKHSANKIMGAFGEKGDRTIDEAIRLLEEEPDYKKPETWPDSVDYDIHIPRWEKERESALKWLKAYKETHGF
jgi:hypothetical protein